MPVPKVTARRLVIITLRGLAVITVIFLGILLAVDHVFPALGLDIPPRVRHIALVAAVCLGFAWASGLVLKELRANSRAAK